MISRLTDTVQVRAAFEEFIVGDARVMQRALDRVPAAPDAPGQRPDHAAVSSPPAASGNRLTLPVRSASRGNCRLPLHGRRRVPARGLEGCADVTGLTSGLPARS